MPYKETLLSFIVAMLLLVQYGCHKSCTSHSNCNLEPDPGPCRASISKYYFDQNDNTCKEFIWGGCQGVVPFDSMQACEICKCND